MKKDADIEEFCRVCFEQFMTTDEEGNEWLLSSDLRDALECLGAPKSVDREMLRAMDPERSGKIGYAEFESVCYDLVRDIFSKESNEDYDDDDDEDYTDAAADGAVAEKFYDHDLWVHVFEVLSEGSGRITIESLGRVCKKINLPITQPDLEKLVGHTSTREEWARLGPKLHPKG